MGIGTSYTYEEAVRRLIVIGVYVIVYFGMLLWLWVTRDKSYKPPKPKKFE